MADQQTIDLHFPAAGLDQSSAFWKQSPRPVSTDQSVYARTTRDAVNVRVFDAEAHRARGGSRPALTKWLSTPVVRNWIIQELAHIVTKGDAVQFSNSGRVVTLVGCGKGDPYRLRAGDTAWVQPTNNTGNTPPLNFDGIIRSAPNVQRLWFADGINWVYYDPVTDTVESWVANSGTLPQDSGNNAPRLIETWRGRTVLAGWLLDPYGWFMTAVNDPQNMDTNPTPFVSTQAIAGENSPQGLIGDVVTSLCAYNDDRLIFFGDHSIYIMTGDPCSGGKLDLVTDTIGGVWGKCWCRDPYGNVYFVSNKMGIYVFNPSQAEPQRISQPIEQLITDTNTGEVGIRLIWDDQFQGMHLFKTTLAEPTQADEHLFFEWRTNSWWRQKFRNKYHNPLCCVIFDGNLPTDRVALFGSWDGYVRSFNRNATKDDGNIPIDSKVLFGPFNTAELDEMLLKTLQAVLSETSEEVTYKIFVGSTAEEATSNDPVDEGTWSAGRNPTSPIDASGYSIYVELSSTNAWQLEQIRMIIQTSGRVRGRNY
jgi:hypothetical protein